MKPERRFPAATYLLASLLSVLGLACVLGGFYCWGAAGEIERTTGYSVYSKLPGIIGGGTVMVLIGAALIWNEAKRSRRD